MSQFGNSGPVGPGPYRPSQPVGPGGSPYQPPRQKVVYKKSGGGGAKIGVIIAIIVGIGGVSILCCCGGLVGFGIYSQKSEEDEVADLVRNDPVVVQYIGDIQSFNTNFTASNNIDDFDVFVYDVVGTKGSAKLTLKTSYDHNGAVTIIWGRLIDNQGIEHQLRGEQFDTGFDNSFPGF